MAAPDPSISSVLAEILDTVNSLRKENKQLASAIDEVNGRVNVLAGVKQVHDAGEEHCSFVMASTECDGIVPLSTSPLTVDLQDVQMLQLPQSLQQVYNQVTKSLRLTFLYHQVLRISREGQVQQRPGWSHRPES